MSNTQSGVNAKSTKVEKAKTYKVYRKAVGSEDEYKLLATLDADKTSYKDKTAKNGVKYYYYVKPNVSGTTNVGIKVFLTNPEIKSISATGKTKIKVTWDKNSKAAGYRVRYSTSKSFSSYKTVSVSSYKTLTKTLSGLKSNKTYYVKVQSYKKSGGTTYYSAWSDVKSKKTKK